MSLHFVIALRARDYPAPRWMLRLYRAGFLLFGGLLVVCVLILLYAAISIALGVG
jgi:hypothetical protein